MVELLVLSRIAENGSTCHRHQHQHSKPPNNEKTIQKENQPGLFDSDSTASDVATRKVSPEELLVEEQLTFRHIFVLRGGVT